MSVKSLGFVNVAVTFIAATALLITGFTLKTNSITIVQQLQLQLLQQEQQEQHLQQLQQLQQQQL